MKKVNETHLNENINVDENFMFRCIELARKGHGNVSPNPLVGCVIVKNGFEISEGFHEKFGSHHAEVNAINNALRKGLILKGSTLYVNLEPCSHFGKTPPCVDKIIQNKISKVVIGTKDPNPLVNSKGIQKLRKNEIEVVCGVLENDCKELNKFYFKNIKFGIPYITLKAAQTLDGKIAYKKNKSIWISSPESKKCVHKLRSQYDAVLVGRRTIEIDNPQLNVRLTKGRNPFRIVIDKELNLSLHSKIFNDKYTNKTIVLTSSKELLKRINKRKYLERKSIRIIQVKMKSNVLDLKDALLKLSKTGIASILVEGGAFTNSQFIKQNLVDEILIFIAPKIFGKGIDTFNFKDKVHRKIKAASWSKSGEDMLVNIKF